MASVPSVSGLQSHAAETLAHRSVFQAFFHMPMCGLGRGQFRLGREAAALRPSVWPATLLCSHYSVPMPMNERIC